MYAFLGYWLICILFLVWHGERAEELAVTAAQLHLSYQELLVFIIVVTFILAPLLVPVSLFVGFFIVSTGKQKN